MRLSRLIILTATLALWATGAPVKPDFSGTWKLNNDKSTHDSTADRDYVCTIEQKGDKVTITTKATPPPAFPPLDGTFVVNGKLIVDKSSPHYHTTRAVWEGSTLILEVVDKESSKEKAKVLGAIRESWVLSGNGKTLTKFRQNAGGGKVVDQKYVFDKQ